MNKKQIKKVKEGSDKRDDKVRQLQLRKNGENEKTRTKLKKKRRIKRKIKKKRSYKEYLKSNTWKTKRDKVIKRANNKCEICKKNRAWQVHHKTYKRIFKERLCDLLATCGTCHRGEHDLLSDEEIEMAVLKLSESEGYV